MGFNKGLSKFYVFGSGLFGVACLVELVEFKMQRIPLPDLPSGVKANVAQIRCKGAAHKAALACENIYHVEGLAKRLNMGKRERSNRPRGTKGLDEFMYVSS